jgi:hypothetical protein
LLVARAFNEFFSRNKSTVNKQIVEILIVGLLENFSVGVATSSELKFIKMHSNRQLPRMRLLPAARYVPAF